MISPSNFYFLIYFEMQWWHNRYLVSPENEWGNGGGNDSVNADLFNSLKSSSKHLIITKDPTTWVDKVDISASIDALWRATFYAICIWVLRWDQTYFQYEPYQTQLHAYIWSKYGWAYPREHLADFLDIFCKVEFEDLDIPLRFDVYGAIDFEQINALSYSDKEKSTFYLNIVRGDESLPQCHVFLPQISQYIRHNLQWEWSPQDYIKVSELETSLLPDTSWAILLNPEGELDIPRMIRKQGNKKKDTKEILKLVFQGHYPYNEPIFEELISKLIISMGKWETVDYVQEHMEELMLLFFSTKKELQEANLYDGLFYNNTINWNKFNEWAFWLFTAASIPQEGGTIEDFADTLYHELGANPKSDAIGTVEARALAHTFWTSNKQLLTTLYTITQKVWQTAFSRMFSSYVATRFEVRPENILLTCKKRFIEEHIDTLPVSPIRLDLWDEKKRQFCFDILKVLHKFPAVSYDQDTQKIIDKENWLSVPIDHFLTKYTTEQIQQQYGEIITKWIKQVHYTKHCADDLDRLKNEFFPDNQYLSIEQTHSSYYLSYLWALRPVVDFYETRADQTRVQDIQQRIDRLDLFYNDKVENKNMHILFKKFKHVKQEEDLPF